MAGIAYTAIETFDPSDQEAWRKYIEWSKLDHLQEIISLDCALCPTIVPEIIQQDWNYFAPEYFLFGLFFDLTYLLNRINVNCKHQVIATLREPESNLVTLLEDKRFHFKGYDLIDEETQISALTNCGGFDLAFSKNDLSEYGLITDFNQAFEIKNLLQQHYPDEHHACCTVWAIWKMESDV